MSRWVTFHYDMIREHVSDLKVHLDKETALKYFNQHCKIHFQLNTRFKADKLPASYGYPLRKYWGISAPAFKHPCFFAHCNRFFGGRLETTY